MTRDAARRAADDVAAPVQRRLDRLTALLEDARSMPMSASCVVNRGEVLGLLEELRFALPEALRRASTVLQDKESVVQDGRAEADALLERAREQRSALLSKSAVHKAARTEADKLLDEAQAQADAMRLEVEDYVDSKLANFEIVLSKTLGAVQRGRQALAGRTDLDDLGDDDERPLPG